jgi:hypothetical protein
MPRIKKFSVSLMLFGLTAGVGASVAVAVGAGVFVGASVATTGCGTVSLVGAVVGAAAVGATVAGGFGAVWHADSSTTVARSRATQDRCRELTFKSRIL